MCFAFFEQPMTRSRRNALLPLLGVAGLLAGALGGLVLVVPSFKHELKMRWQRWSCPDVPRIRSERLVASDGTSSVHDPFSNDASSLLPGPNLLFDFDSLVVFATINTTLPARGRYLLQGTSSAIVRRIGDVANDLRSVSAGFLLTCADPAPDVRIIIRIDHPDGTLLEWNEKKLLVSEHRPNEQERFNFEWILRDLSTSPDDLVSIFIVGDDEGVWIDDLSVVFRSRTPVRPAEPHA